jgi:hypothetical protein
MVPSDSPLIALTQQGVEAVGNITIAPQQSVTISVSPLVVTDHMIGQKELEVKQHCWPVATSIWLTMMRIDG